MKQARFSGFVLAGGKSSRMGTDKAMLPFSGRPLASIVAERVQQAAGSATILGNPTAYGRLGFPCLADRTPGCGPLSGIDTALAQATSRWNLVVACDLPFISVGFLRCLLQLADREDARGSAGAQLVVARSQRGYELAAVFAKELSAEVSKALSHERYELARLYEVVRRREVGPSEYGVFDPAGLLFHNINTPDDLSRALKRAGAS